ncbi:putative nucleotidyltransferase component of viral defense system [Phyllobacterium trifolii]|uniref:Putative nucleotidyltransferase component of viral defense system n=1 Tax=Phyllobacterium trifolii TaxID=300193 RepID=A0A839UFK5_9HYPH|nr:nucleotidyl transferase AbiEii/AbiGii toxin family protein [Phyllobacterium trifolii]MBB3148573.1 putative nucleotidyltransferase component of viral defense system [Phyllobacterium trifolii]
MPVSEQYRQQVALLIQTLPAVAEEKDFALKGGTAINLFVRDMPRLSVDIDLTFLPVMPRDESLAAIKAALLRIKKRIEDSVAGVRVFESRQNDGNLTRLVVQDRNRTQIKIEVTPVLRGCVFAPEIRSVSAAVEDDFGFAEIQVVSFADLYAGKIMAALDRQHPRDLFDIRDLLANEGITDELRQGFVVYLISHGRPLAEVIASNQKDIAAEYERNFAGMTAEDVPLAELHAARAQLVEILIGGMPQAHREFLVGFKKGEPDWKKLGLAGAAELPAVKFKQLNLDKLPKDVRAKLVANLAEKLGVAL